MFVSILFYFMCTALLIFLQLNIKSSYINKSHNSTINHSNTNKTINNDMVIRFFVISLFLILVYLFIYKGYSESIWFNHLKINNTSLFLFLTFVIIILSILAIFNNKITLIKRLQFDYFFTIYFLSITLPILFFCNNILTFFFILELVSCLILLQFVIGRDWENLISTKKSLFFNYSSGNKSTSFINIIFFQYWVSFFSSVLIVYALLMFLYYYGTTEWVLINFLSSYDFYQSGAGFNISLYINYVVFLIAFFFKLGVAPVHFYKIEIYKGLPFITILIYTIYFFFIFFIFFGLLVTNYLAAANIVWFNLGSVLLIVGVIIVMFLLFDISALKAFFAYSTIVNSMAFLALVISLI